MDRDLARSRSPLRLGLGISKQFSRSGGLRMGRHEVRMGSAETAIHSLIRRAANVYTAGPAVEDARGVCDRLAREGIASTVCYWDIYADHPDSILQAYMGLLVAMSSSASDCYLSVKAPALKFDIDRLKKVLD